MYMIFLGFILIDTSNKTNVVNPTTSPVPPPPMRTDKNKNTRYSLFWKVNLSLYSKLGLASYEAIEAFVEYHPIR